MSILRRLSDAAGARDGAEPSSDETVPATAPEVPSGEDRLPPPSPRLADISAVFGAGAPDRRPPVPAPPAPVVVTPEVAAVFGTEAPVNRLEPAVAPAVAPVVAPVVAPEVAHDAPQLAHDVAPGLTHDVAPVVEPEAASRTVVPDAPVAAEPPQEIVQGGQQTWPSPIDPSVLEDSRVLDGVIGLPRERLGGLLAATASSYRAVLAELETARAGAAQSAHDAYGALGEQVAGILRAAHEAAEETRRLGHTELDNHRAEVDGELTRRAAELDERARTIEQRAKTVEEEVAATTTRARQEAERLSTRVRTEAEERLAAILATQESLREQLTRSSEELRLSLDSLSPVAD